MISYNESMPERDAHRRDKNELLFQKELKKIMYDMKKKSELEKLRKVAGWGWWWWWCDELGDWD